MTSFANSWVINRHIDSFAQHYLPGGVRKGKEWVVSGIDGNKGSSMNFCVEGDRAGLWIDNATGQVGNPISLVMKQRNASYEDAIREIEEVFSVPSVPNFKPYAPVNKPAIATYDFFFIGADKSTPLMAVHRYEYENDDGELTKESRPYVISEDFTKWLPGAPAKRPLYRLDKLRPKTRIVIVEGEKKADYLASVLPSIDGNIDVIAWPMGASQAHLADWTQIYGRNILIWPDNDDAGMRAANVIKGILHTAVILPIPKDKPKAWDCGNATPHEISEILKPQEELPFQLLGVSKDKYYFYMPKTFMTYEINATDLSLNTLLYLAPRDWWIGRFPLSNKKEITIHAQKAIDWINRQQQEMGNFFQRTIYGAGTDMVNGKFLVNCGKKIYLDDLETEERISENYLIRTERFIKDPYVNDNDFHYQQVVEAFDKFDIDDKDALLGWLCLAPLCGILHWRPHIWLTGHRGSGKSTCIEKVIMPLLGDWAINFLGTATTEAGIRREIKTSALPVIFDEAEGNSKSEDSKRNMERILSLVTASSTKGSSEIKKGTNKEVEIFKVQNMFCFSCTEPPLLKSAEITRITLINFMPKDHRDDFDYQIKGNFIARQIKERHKIIEFANHARKIVLEKTGDPRFADQYGMLYGAAIYMRSNGMMSIAELTQIILDKYLDKLLGIKTHQDETSNDGKILISKLMSYQIREGQVTYTISELIARGRAGDKVSCQMLGKYGIRIDDPHLLITPNSTALDTICKKLHGDLWFEILCRYKDAVSYNTKDRKRIGYENSARYAKVLLSSLNVASHSPTTTSGNQSGNIVKLFGERELYS